MSIYELKPRFQALLRPAVRGLFALGVTANQVTLAACAISVGLGLLLFFRPEPAMFALIPAWMLLRMAFNAIDGMLAVEFGQRSKLGLYFNELTDVVSDAALYLPFAALASFSAFWVGVVIVLAGVCEYAGALGVSVGATRRYDGPMGKSDRAFVFGALGLWVALVEVPATIALAILVALALLIAFTTLRRVRAGLLASEQPRP